MKKLAVFLLVFSLALPAAAPLAPAAAPAEAYISGVIGHAQTYALSCESRSASDLAAFWGVTANEITFFNALPKSDNPEVGFVGNVHGTWGQIPPNAYGVHAKPVAKTLRQFGLDAQAHRGMGFAVLKDEIAAGRPVIVWVIGGVWAGTPVTYHAQDGSTTIVAKYEHTMIMIGYDQNNVYLVDAGSGKNRTHSISNFKNSWNVLGNLAVTARREGGNDGPPDDGLGETYEVRPGDYLTKLAKAWGISWQDLAALNNIVYPYVIHPGQILLTGRNLDPTATPKPKPKPTKKPKTPVPTDTPEPTPKPKPTKVPKPKNNTYTVLSGEHLMQIARKLQLNWQEIARRNGLVPPYLVYPGQVLQLPGKGNGGNKPDPTPVPTPKPKPSGNTYVVKQGDYLVALGRSFGISWQVLASINNITYPYIVYPGQVLKMP